MQAAGQLGLVPSQLYGAQVVLGPAGTTEQVPRVVGWSQLSQEPPHSVLQHTPPVDVAAQEPLIQLSPVVQAAPLAIFGAQSCVSRSQ